MSALLQNMDLYDQMLTDYAEGGGSALEQSNRSAESLTGSLNRLSNSWTEFVNGFVDSDGMKTGVDLLNGLVKGIAGLTSHLGSLGTIGLGAGLFAGVKNIGKRRMSVRIS